jgi:hypothetical protein
MKRQSYFVALVAVLLALALVACGGGDGGSSGPPVEMKEFDGSSFNVEYPSDWKESSIDMFGLTMVIFGKEELSMTDLQSLDFGNMMTNDPLALIMSVPAEMAGDMGFDDIDSALDEFDNAIPEGEGEIIKQGDTSIGGANGKIVIAKGNAPDVGDVGMHLVAAKKDDGAAIVFMGITPATDRDRNLEIFQYMHDSFQFTD